MMTPRKEKFVEHYLRLDDATAAAKAAGYSEKTAYSQGSRLLKDVDVAAAISTARKQVMSKLRLDAEWVIRRFMHIADADPAALLDEHGAMKAMKDIPRRARRAIASMVVEAETPTHGRLTKVKFRDSGFALDKLGRHVGIYQRDNEQVAKTLADLVPRASREEAEEQPEEAE